MTIGYVIKMLRRDKGWTQKELAAKAGIATSTMYNIERGERSPSFRNAAQVLDALGYKLQVVKKEASE